MAESKDRRQKRECVLNKMSPPDCHSPRPATTPFMRPVTRPARYPPSHSRDDLSIKWKPVVAKRNNLESFSLGENSRYEYGRPGRKDPRPTEEAGQRRSLVASSNPAEGHCLSGPKASRWAESLLESVVR